MLKLRDHPKLLSEKSQNASNAAKMPPENKKGLIIVIIIL